MNTTQQSESRFDILVGIHVHDEDGYQKYRDGMTPILHESGGDFQYDFRISEMLKGEAEHPINRVFVITFPDQSSMESFFKNPDYMKIRAQYFDTSVSSSNIIAQYHA